MTSFLISAGIVVCVVGAALLRRHPAPPKWVSAEAQLQLCREIRRPPRIPFSTKVVLRGLSGADSVSAESQDLSIGGMLLKPSVPLVVGQPIYVSFQLTEATHIDIPAVVCRTVGKSYGIRFDVTDKQRAIVGEWVEQHRTAVKQNRMLTSSAPV